MILINNQNLITGVDEFKMLNVQKYNFFIK